MERVLAADNEGAGVFRSDDPLRRTRGAQPVMWTIEAVESPIPTKRSGDLAVQVRRLSGMGIDRKSSEQWIGGRRKIDRMSVLRLDMKYDVVREFGGKYQRGAVGGKQQRWLTGTQNLRGIDRS